jgi:hypothetical protein
MSIFFQIVDTLEGVVAAFDGNEAPIPTKDADRLREAITEAEKLLKELRLFTDRRDPSSDEFKNRGLDEEKKMCWGGEDTLPIPAKVIHANGHECVWTLNDQRCIHCDQAFAEDRLGDATWY